MHRLMTALGVASLLSLSVLGLVLAAPDGPAAEGPDPVTGLAFDDIDIYMSAEPGGEAHPNFDADTHRLYANVAYEGASNERFAVRVLDLSGITIKDEETPPLSGDGVHSVSIAITDVIASYSALIDAQSETLRQSSDRGASNCESIPDVPDEWPPPPGEPPSPYTMWREDTLTAMESAQLASAEISRTLQAALSLPDIESDLPSAADGLEASRSELIGAGSELTTARPLLGTSDREPEPAQACEHINEAKRLVDEALGSAEGALEEIAAHDTGSWSFPSTSAQYIGTRFVGCLQYTADLFAIVGGQRNTTATDATQWTLGSPGDPALVFPGPDLVDSSTVGTLGRKYSGDSTSMYASSVTVPGVNHKATISAFVTDAACIPVDDTTIDFRIEPDDPDEITPEQAGTLDPASMTISDGQAETMLTAGAVAARAAVVAEVCEDEACDDPAVGSAHYEVIGPADRLVIRVRPETINILENEVAGIGVQVRDAKNKSVADGTEVTVSIDEDDPGVLALGRYERVDGERQLVLETIGKQAQLITRDGHTLWPTTDSDGTRPGLYLTAEGPEDVGYTTIIAEADDARATTNTESDRQTIQIVREFLIHLPFAEKR